MFKINRKLEYALMALKHMYGKHQGELTTAKEICTAYGSPFDATARVLQILAQKGVLSVSHGAHGGYHVHGDLRRVSFLDLCEWILGPMKVADCMDEDDICQLTGECNIVGPIRALNTRLKDFYRDLSVRDLIDSERDAHARKQQRIEV